MSFGRYRLGDTVWAMPSGRQAIWATGHLGDAVWATGHLGDAVWAIGHFGDTQFRLLNILNNDNSVLSILLEEGYWLILISRYIIKRYTFELQQSGDDIFWMRSPHRKYRRKIEFISKYHFFVFAQVAYNFEMWNKWYLWIKGSHYIYIYIHVK